MSKVPSLSYTEVIRALQRIAGSWSDKRAVISDCRNISPPLLWVIQETRLDPITFVLDQPLDRDGLIQKYVAVQYRMSFDLSKEDLGIGKVNTTPSRP
jgi:hypothetical protein